MEQPPARRPWFLIAAAVALLLVLGWVLFGAYIPSRQRVAGLEAEIRDVYQKEAELQTQLAQSLQRNALLQQQIAAVTAERDGLVRRTRDLEQELASLRRRPPRRR